MAKQISLQTTKPVVPMIYAYTTPEIARHDGWTKIGYTEQDVKKRIAQQTRTADVVFKEEWRGTAVFDDGSGDAFRDTDFHAYLRKQGVEQEEGKTNEWFRISGSDSKQKFNTFRTTRGILETPGARPYVLRREQDEAVQRAKDFFESTEKGEFLWNAKPRFGKTLAVYDLCLRMGAKAVLIVTNRPTIANSWYDDYCKFVGDEKGYRFVSETPALKGKLYVITYDQYSKTPGLEDYIEFLSLQDLKGSIYFGGTQDKLKHIRDNKWDILVVDEAHEGVDTTKTDVAFDRIARKHTIHLSGTPFKALANNKFSSDAIFNWTYADEQRAKREWPSESETPNPYAELPRLCMYTYQMSEMIRNVVKQGIEIDGEPEEYAFDLNEFFAVRESGKFVHEDSVDRFLDALTTQEKYPFSTDELRAELKHTFWLLNRVESARSLAKKLKNHPVFSEYKIVLAAGDGRLDPDSEILDSYKKVTDAIKENDKTITLSVGQLTTGVTIPEWSAVLMLSNVSSPALYMQAAFRAQNPWLCLEGKSYRRKENAYVFDFDPARTLIIFEQFANDLNAETTGGRGDSEARRENIRELLNFFPVVGEDEEGEMIELDAEQVMSIPRRIKAVEVVKRGFMSNFLFQNIGAVFQAPQEVIDIIRSIEPAKEEKISRDKMAGLSPDSRQELSINDEGEIDLAREIVIGAATDLFGDKIFRPVEELVDPILDEVDASAAPEKTEESFNKLETAIKSEIIDAAVERVKERYGDAFTKSAQNAVTREVENKVKAELAKELNNFNIDAIVLKQEEAEKLEEAVTDQERREIRDEYAQKRTEATAKLREDVTRIVGELTLETERKVATRVETDIRLEKKNTHEDGVRDHLRGFSRTIPSFLMAYGSDQEITLANFDAIVPDDVFLEVTSITLDNFRFLRDGGDYVNKETGETEHFKGRLFDEVVFNDSVKEFLALKRKLANYFDEEHEEDIFDYIPPQKTNQIFTPKKVVVQKVDLLEKENPGCFDDPEHTFADLYMKSGLYLAEIVKRLYRSEKLKALYPDSTERLNHIFSKQVYGLAPTEIIYRITLAFVLGFKEDFSIDAPNIRLCDALEFAKEGTLDKKLAELFPERAS